MCVSNSCVVAHKLKYNQQGLFCTATDCTCTSYVSSHANRLQVHLDILQSNITIISIP